MYFPPWPHPPYAPSHNGPTKIKAVVPSQNAAVAKRLPVPSLATICAARTAFSSRLECPEPTGSHQGSGKQHLGPALPAKSLPAQSSLLASRPPIDQPELGKLCHPPSPISPPVPPARSEEPAALLSCQQASTPSRPTGSKSYWDKAWKGWRLSVLKADGHILSVVLP